MAGENGLRPPKSLDTNSSDPTTWEDWLQAYEWYETAVQLETKTPEVQVATFMSVIGTEAQKIFRTFNLTESEKKDVKVIKKRFTEHFTPRINHAYERYKFNKRREKPDYVTAARLQASRYNYGSLTEELLCDRIIVGVRNDFVREQLLTDPTLDLQKAIYLCRGKHARGRRPVRLGSRRLLLF
ncbi:hypothetical protein HPB50_016533 [Hyalomma asiaticum]|uniref:Uncharacterized protein n=1 Tax=Hyalomma asiaticum TaxID=266040 RepID=A0ACB7SFS7_HYAAI|nr:hypothetical protein HPB50_016533 [Hyalomma asiaticum]